MNSRKTIMDVAVLLLVMWGSVQAASVTWTAGTTPVAKWSINPSSPTASDVITFTGPTKVYSNSCVGEGNLGGTPQITVDTAAKVILLWFQGPAPEICTLIYRPVCGLEGEFGPLPAGDWTFTTLSKDILFEIKFTIGGKAAYHVDGDAPGPAHDGRSWATAFLTLQDALAAAASGDEILVAEGTHKPDQGGAAARGDREASFVLKEGLTVRGGYAGYGRPNPDERNMTSHETILSGDLRSDDLWHLLNVDDNSYQVVTGPMDEPAALLDGVTITAGHGDGPYPHHDGGGLYNPGGKLQIRSCTLRHNTAVWGGGLMNLSGAVTLVNCQLIGNRAMMLGGGLYNEEGDVALHNCRVVGNTADYAEIAGGAALYNLNGTLTILDSTVADNLSPSGMAIASFNWSTPVGPLVKIANSILFNGGEEVWSRDPALVEVTYSDVQGGWSGLGNINAAPQFVAPGGRSIEGEWVDGDYRLQAGSPAIDTGSNAALPPDVLDLDADGNVTEAIPVDLDNEARVEGASVDMGAYEQLAKKPPLPEFTLTVCFGGSCLTLSPDPSDPTHKFVGKSKFQIDGLNFKAQVDVSLTPTSPAGGTWTGGMTPNIIGPGTGIVTEVWITGEGLDLSALPASPTTVQVAEMNLDFTPVP